jgi:hypothetical protein
MLADPLMFPLMSPPTYELLSDEPTFDPRRHLALEAPANVWSLSDLGYSATRIRKCASEVAVAGPFRLLSQEGVEAARAVASGLRKVRQTSDRTANYVAGGVYRSRFLRDLCQCREITAFLSQIAGCELLPHTMPSQQIYINYAPEDLSRAVDTWHVDSIGFDYVLLINDPATFAGGQFQFFRGTKDEAAEILRTTTDDLTGPIQRELSAERVITPGFPAAGYAIFQQGNLVMHRATSLTRRAERTTFVPGLVARDTRYPDPTLNGVTGWGEPGIVAEFARHKAWLVRSRLDQLIEAIDLAADPARLRDALRDSVADVVEAIALLDGISPTARRNDGAQ